MNGWTRCLCLSCISDVGKKWSGHWNLSPGGEGGGEGGRGVIRLLFGTKKRQHAPSSKL